MRRCTGKINCKIHQSNSMQLPKQALSGLLLRHLADFGCCCFFYFSIHGFQPEWCFYCVCKQLSQMRRKVMYRKEFKKKPYRNCVADKHSLDIHPGDGSRKQLSESAQRDQFPTTTTVKPGSGYFLSNILRHIKCFVPDYIHKQMLLLIILFTVFQVGKNDAN